MNAVPVTVYTIGPECVQCEMTKKTLTRLGVDFTEVDLREHPDKADELKAQGYLAAPVVTTDRKTWAGFRLDKIQSLARHVKGENK